MSKSQRTKALEIPPKVKKAVAHRDSVDDYPCCLWCGKPAPTDNITAFSCAHFLPRSRGGLGIEQNILTLCWDCHMQYDQSDSRERMGDFFKGYLKSKYPDWREENLIYKKGL